MSEQSEQSAIFTGLNAPSHVFKWGNNTFTFPAFDMNDPVFMSYEEFEPDQEFFTTFNQELHFLGTVEDKLQTGKYPVDSMQQFFHFVDAQIRIVMFEYLVQYNSGLISSQEFINACHMEMNRSRKVIQPAR